MTQRFFRFVHNDGLINAFCGGCAALIHPTNLIWIPAFAGMTSGYLGRMTLVYYFSFVPSILRWNAYQKGKKKTKLADPLIVISPLALQGGCPRSGRGVNKNPSASKLATAFKKESKTKLADPLIFRRSSFLRR